MGKSGLKWFCREILVNKNKKSARGLLENLKNKKFASDTYRPVAALPVQDLTGTNAPSCPFLRFCYAYSVIKNDDDYFTAITALLTDWHSGRPIHEIGYQIKNYAALRWPREDWPVAYSESPTLLITQDLSYIDFPKEQ